MRNFENTSRISRFTIKWPLPNPAFRIQSSPHDPPFFHHQPASGRLSYSTRTIQAKRVPIQAHKFPQIFARRWGPCPSPKTSGCPPSLAFGDREMQYPGRALPFSRKRETEHSPGWKTLVRIHPLPRRPCGPPRPNHSGQIRAQLHCEQNPNKQCIISDLSSYPLQNQRTFQKNG